MGATMQKSPIGGYVSASINFAPFLNRVRATPETRLEFFRSTASARIERPCEGIGSQKKGDAAKP
jgi:hypothetical protein